MILSYRDRVLAGVLLGVVVFALAGCGEKAGDSTGKAALPNAESTSETFQAAPPKINLESPLVRIETSLGAIVVRLDGVRASGTVRNFLDYANDRYYDNTLIHYVDAGKMILAGGYAANYEPKAPRGPIRNEAHNGLKNKRATLAMTRIPGQIDSATSQFFINLADAPQRDHVGDSPDQYGYCVFGEVTEGLDVAENISQSPTTDRGGDLTRTPTTPVVIRSIRLVRE